MCTQQNADVDCCWPCSAVDSGNNDYHCPCFNIPSGVKVKNEWTVTSTPPKHSKQITNLCYTNQTSCNAIKHKISGNADPGGRAVWGVGLGRLYCWDWGIESRGVRWCVLLDLCVLSVVCCECCVRWSRGLFVGLITCPEESNRMWLVWVWSDATVTLNWCSWVGREMLEWEREEVKRIFQENRKRDICKWN